MKKITITLIHRGYTVSRSQVWSGTLNFDSIVGMDLSLHAMKMSEYDLEQLDICKKSV